VLSYSFAGFNRVFTERNQEEGKEYFIAVDLSQSMEDVDYRPSQTAGPDQIWTEIKSNQKPSFEAELDFDHFFSSEAFLMLHFNFPIKLLQLSIDGWNPG